MKTLDYITLVIAVAAIVLATLISIDHTHTPDEVLDIGTALTCEQIQGVVVCIER